MMGIIIKRENEDGFSYFTLPFNFDHTLTLDKRGWALTYLSLDRQVIDFLNSEMELEKSLYLHEYDNLNQKLTSYEILNATNSSADFINSYKLLTLPFFQKTNRTNKDYRLLFVSLFDLLSKEEDPTLTATFLKVIDKLEKDQQFDFLNEKEKMNFNQFRENSNLKSLSELFKSSSNNDKLYDKFETVKLNFLEKLIDKKKKKITQDIDLLSITIDKNPIEKHAISIQKYQIIYLKKYRLLLDDIYKQAKVKKEKGEDFFSEAEGKVENFNTLYSNDNILKYAQCEYDISICKTKAENFLTPNFLKTIDFSFRFIEKSTGRAEDIESTIEFYIKENRNLVAKKFSDALSTYPGFNENKTPEAIALKAALVTLETSSVSYGQDRPPQFIPPMPPSPLSKFKTWSGRIGITAFVLAVAIGIGGGILGGVVFAAGPVALEIWVITAVLSGSLLGIAALSGGASFIAGRRLSASERNDKNIANEQIPLLGNNQRNPKIELEPRIEVKTKIEVETIETEKNKNEIQNANLDQHGFFKLPKIEGSERVKIEPETPVTPVTKNGL